MTEIVAHSFVLYKSKPARVLHASDKLEIQLEDGQTRKVRPKDVDLLHPGPLNSLKDIKAMSGEVEIGWEILAGETTDVRELAELIFDQVTPSSVWATWEYVADGLYFYGEPNAVVVREAAELAAEKAQRAARDADQQAWSDFIGRVKAGEILPAERENLSSVEALALGRTQESRVLRALGRGVTSENAHALLLRLGHWDETLNPYPDRFDLPIDAPAVELGELAEEQRRDLTHLAAFAIDDQGNQDPDDAISIDGDRLWVHVADAAALVPPNSQADIEARARGSNLYMPETTVHMLPPKATELLGLGLQEISPALSISARIDEFGELHDIEITPSLVRVQRLSYAEVDLSQAPFPEMLALTDRFAAKRVGQGAATLNLPEVKIRVHEDDITIRALPRLPSRELVTEAMLAAGQAAAKFALQHNIPFPFTGQAPPDAHEAATDMAAMFAMRKHFKRSQTHTQPEPHTGLGLNLYTRATSPLRRYSDLLAHQQLRAHLADQPLLSPQELSERLATAETVSDLIRRAERFSNKHWTMVYLKRNPGWRGEGVVVDLRGKRGVVLIPELGLETQLTLDRDVALNDTIQLELASVDLPELTARFIPQGLP